MDTYLEAAMEDKNLYIKIAHWYYTLGMTQDEIAKRLFTAQRNWIIKPEGAGKALLP